MSDQMSGESMQGNFCLKKIQQQQKVIKKITIQ